MQVRWSEYRTNYSEMHSAGQYGKQLNLLIKPELLKYFNKKAIMKL